MKNLTILALLLFTSLSFASGDNSTDTTEASITALNTFKDENSSDVVSKFSGLEASASGHGVTVNVKFTEGEPLVYNCHRHEAGDPFECHED